jgi:hypothetical protein
LRIYTGCMAHRGSRGTTLPFLDHGTRRGWGDSVTPQLLFTPRKDPVPIVQEVGRAPGPVWTGAENLTPTGIQTPDHLDCSQSLYWLCYPAHYKMDTLYINPYPAWNIGWAPNNASRWQMWFNSMFKGLMF